MPRLLPYRLPTPDSNKVSPMQLLLEIHTEEEDVVIVLTSSGNLEVR